MKKILMMIMLTLSFAASGDVVLSKDQKIKSDAITVFNDPKSNDADIAKSILTFEKYAAYDNVMLFYLGKANYYEATKLLTLDKTKGRNYIERAAVKGLHTAEYEYAVILMLERQKPKAISYLKKASQRNNNEAQYTLGKMYYLGDGVPKSKKNGFSLISSSAQNGNGFAQYDLAKIYFSQQKESIQKNGVYWLKRSVDNGNLNACNELYKLYETGILIEKNTGKHLEYLQCSAKNGNSDAEYLLATYYATGKYVENDPHKSAYWFKRVAEKGDASASVHYANYIFKFFTKERDKTSKAIEYLNKISASSMDASMMLGQIYAKGLYKNPVNNLKAIKHYENAKKLGNEEAQYKIIELLAEKG